MATTNHLGYEKLITIIILFLLNIIAKMQYSTASLVIETSMKSTLPRPIDAA